MIFPAPPDFESITTKQRIENVNDLLRELSIENSGLREKIRSWANRYGFNEETILYRVKADPVFAMQFAKEPGRQKIHERVAAEFLRQVPLISDFLPLPPDGKNAMYVYNGMVMNGETLKSHKVESTPKSIDFSWVVKLCGSDLKCFATHKYTKESGGSQDNQRKNAEEFLQNASKCRDPNMLFLAILDGDYYQRGIPTVLSHLEDTYGKSNIKICCSGNFIPTFFEHLYRWMEVNRIQPTSDFLRYYTAAMNSA